LRLPAGRDRSAARTALGGEFPALALSIREVGAYCHHGQHCRRPPCDPGRWAFPSPVLTLASQRAPSHTVHSSSADSHTPYPLWFASTGAPLFPGPTMSGYAWSCQGPRAPVHVPRCDLARHDVTHHVSRHSPLHGSYGLRRQSSTLLVPRSYPPHQVCAGGCQPLRGEGPSRHYLCAAVPAGLAPYPGGACGALPRFFPQALGLPLVWTGAALHHGRAATSARRPCRGGRHALMGRPAGVLPTPVAPTATTYTAGQPWFLRPRLSWVVTSPRPGYAGRPHRTIDGRGLLPETT
jgi:hypothetical protein